MLISAGCRAEAPTRLPKTAPLRVSELWGPDVWPPRPSRPREPALLRVLRLAPGACSSSTSVCPHAHIARSWKAIGHVRLRLTPMTWS